MYSATVAASLAEFSVSSWKWNIKCSVSKECQFNSGWLYKDV